MIWHNVSYQRERPEKSEHLWISFGSICEENQYDNLIDDLVGSVLIGCEFASKFFEMMGGSNLITVKTSDSMHQKTCKRPLYSQFEYWLNIELVLEERKWLDKMISPKIAKISNHTRFFGKKMPPETNVAPLTRKPPKTSIFTLKQGFWSNFLVSFSNRLGADISHPRWPRRECKKIVQLRGFLPIEYV